ncbi:hypothetical protein NliqN6_1536 [Naganishia liquefaciens]|uniref:Ketoreductase domain-containing protein n=1 Tax=Naganishia liquefaciens TaxID=104408 RepID=A0A8H3YDB9_9TREE|nr:hypothetical protein NliqN6_1536 [Naganishia liquefaciens]
MVFSIDFSGKNYVVTGGNRGIGLAISRAIADAGGSVAILYRSSPDAEQVAANLSESHPGQQFKAYKCDVTDQARVQEVFQEVLKDFKGGMIHGVVANAGVAIVRDALEIGQEEFDFMYKTNVLGVFFTAQAAAKIWKEKDYKTGAIVVISSMSSQIYNQEGLNKPLKHVFYNSSKAAVSSMSKALAAEWAPYGIRVNIVSPGYVMTEQSGVHPKEVREFQSNSVPLGRYSDPQEQTSQVILLLSEHSSYQTGSEVFIDGGYLIW